ncbi:DUF5683 domain-containing protein [Marinilabilia rubra]|uniref:DUF5683 domain-containing protein n=1 Tax=Marinilabilia rubra TaxID=2162893 RepID=A0A2U2BDA8_9BACT|nr:DUF5683 domain-containing protein [Marinilabilia rubra]PWE01052.1 hypothetical protein DDZ16_00765 [Marinilabilia rubra]
MDFMTWRGFTKLLAVLFILYMAGTSSLQAQIKQGVDTTIVSQSTTDSISITEGTTVEEAFKQKEEEKIHSPHKATFYSAILPGLGQAYNKKYWKIPILYAGIGALGYAIHFNSTNYTKYKNAYRDFLIRDPGNKSYEKVIPVNLTVEDVEGQYADWFQQALENKREYYRRYRDLSYIGMAAVYLLNMIDATVDAHFYNFDVSDDLSMNIRPAVLEPDPFSGNKIGIQLSLNF